MRVLGRLLLVLLVVAVAGGVYVYREQSPLLHTSPGAQAAPQAPQFKLSVLRSRQTPLQSVSPPPHETVQMPRLHTSPAAQEMPQDPQF